MARLYPKLKGCICTIEEGRRDICNVSDSAHSLAKAIFNPRLWDDVAVHLMTAPKGQISEVIKEHIHKFVDKYPHPTALQAFKFMDEIHQCTEISSFVRVLCDVRRFYLEPSE